MMNGGMENGQWGMRRKGDERMKGDRQNNNKRKIPLD